MCSSRCGNTISLGRRLVGRQQAAVVTLDRSTQNNYDVKLMLFIFVIM